MEKTRVLVATVTETERNEIENLFERLNSLRSLSITLAANNDLYKEKSHLVDKIVADISETQNRYNRWWQTIIEKYGMDMANQANYEIDFIDCKLYDSRVI